MKIGFFDSGLGGLTIMESVRRQMPQYDYLFYGDTKNLPYGDKSEKEIYELTKAGVEYLFSNEASIAVIACNTASAETLRRLQDTYLIQKHPDKRILGVIVPTIEEVIEQKLKNVLLIGTNRTVDSQKYEKELQKCVIKGIEFHGLATPELVPLIEEGKIDEAVDHVVGMLDQHIDSGGDAVVLGCTHYSILKEPLRELYGDVFDVVSQDEIIPLKLQKYLHMHPEYETKLSKASTYTIHLTGK